MCSAGKCICAEIKCFRLFEFVSLSERLLFCKTTQTNASCCSLKWHFKVCVSILSGAAAHRAWSWAQRIERESDSSGCRGPPDALSGSSRFGSCKDLIAKPKFHRSQVIWQVSFERADTAEPWLGPWQIPRRTP